MVVVPALISVANPVLLIVAIAVFEELQVTLLLMSLELPSVNVAVAVNCCVVVDAMLTLGLIGLMAIEDKGDVSTVTVVDPVAAPDEAERVTLPALTAVATPELLTASTVMFDVLQAAELSTLVEPSS